MVRNQEAGVWEQFDVEEIHGRTMGIVGYGEIGRAAAERAHAMGMKIVALRRSPELSSNDPIVEQVLFDRSTRGDDGCLGLCGGGRSAHR